MSVPCFPLLTITIFNQLFHHSSCEVVMTTLTSISSQPCKEFRSIQYNHSLKQLYKAHHTQSIHTGPGSWQRRSKTCSSTSADRYKITTASKSRYHIWASRSNSIPQNYSPPSTTVYCSTCIVQVRATSGHGPPTRLLSEAMFCLNDLLNERGRDGWL